MHGMSNKNDVSKAQVHTDNASKKQPRNNALPMSTSQMHPGEAEVELYSFLTSVLDEVVNFTS